MKADLLIMTIEPQKAFDTILDILCFPSSATEHIDQLFLLHDTSRHRWTYNANRILSGCAAEAFVLLNDDVDLTFSPDWLGRLLEELSQPNVGFTGPSGPCRTPPQSQGWPNMPRNTLEVSHLSGFCLACRTATLRQAGGFDSDLVHGGSDVAIQWTAHTFGWKSIWVQDVYVGHEIGAADTIDEHLLAIKKRDEQTLYRKFPMRSPDINHYSFRNIGGLE